MTYLEVEKIGLIGGDEIEFETLSGVRFDGVFLSADSVSGDIIIETSHGRFPLIWNIDWIRIIIKNNK